MGLWRQEDSGLINMWQKARLITLHFIELIQLFHDQVKMTQIKKLIFKLLL